jgi:hypothetical protein
MLSEVDHVGQRDLIHREEGDSPAVDHSKQNRSLAHTYMVYGFVILRVLCNNKKHLTLFSLTSNAYNISYILTQKHDRSQLLNRPDRKIMALRKYELGETELQNGVHRISLFDFLCFQSEFPKLNLNIYKRSDKRV